MDALSEKERADLREKIDAMDERAAAHGRKAAELREQAKALRPDIASGVAGAAKKAQDLEAQAQESDLAATACRSEGEAAQSRLDDDAPHREAERQASLLAAKKDLAGQIIAADRDMDDASAAIWAAAGRRAKAIADLSRMGFSVTELPDLSYSFPSVQAAAGGQAFVPAFSPRPGAPETFSQYDAERLAVLLPSDDPAVVANRTRRAAAHAEYVRLNSQPLPEPRKYHPPGLCTR